MLVEDDVIMEFRRNGTTVFSYARYRDAVGRIERREVVGLVLIGVFSVGYFSWALVALRRLKRNRVAP